MKINIKKIHIIFLTACIITIVLNLIVTDFNILRKCSDEYIEDIKKIKIVIDAGHGGIDPGAVGNYKYNEDVINLFIANKLVTYLEGTGFDIIMTRYDNEGLYTEKSNTYRSRKNEDLSKRVEIINNSCADICISIHLNYFPQRKYYGAQSFYKKNCIESKTAAETVQSELKSILDKNNTRVAMVKSDIIIMKYTKIPVILVECGFLSNPEEEKLLNSDIYQEKIAWAIFSGILKYFNEKENKEENKEDLNELSAKDILNAASTYYNTGNW